MSRLPQNENTDNNPELQEAYQAASDAGWVLPDGSLLRFVKSFSEKPNILKSILTLDSEISAGTVPPTVKQMIGMTVAKQNDCKYCEVISAGALEALGVPGDVIQSCASDPELTEVPPSQRAIINFALKMSKDPKSLNEEDFDSLREFGMSDAEILEVISYTSLANFYDNLADAMALVVEGSEEAQ